MIEFYHWSSQAATNKEHILAACVIKHKAYKRNEERRSIRACQRDVFKSPAFAGCTPIDFSKKWERMVKLVKNKFALEEEGANLSGLPENVSPDDCRSNDVPV
jgi:hypothetical protein